MKRPRLITAIAALGLIAATLWLTARPVVESLTRPALPAKASAAARGAAAFEGAGFGGVSLDALSSNAVPWRIVAAALVLDEQRVDPTAPLDAATLDRVLRRFGFLTGATIVNRAPDAQVVDTGLPLGFTAGDIAPVGGTIIRVSNLGCAACHAGVTYGSDGSPLPQQAMLGMPNSSIDLEAYTMAVFQALRRFGDSEAILPAVDTLFPGLDWRESASLRWIVMPLVKQRLAALASVDRPLPFPNGAPGSTNGVPALKAALGHPLIDGGLGETGVVSIPDLGDRVWRSSLLVDGAYAVPGKTRQAKTTPDMIDDAHLKSLAAITTFFTVPSMGVHPDKAVTSLDDAVAIMAFLKDYRPQPYPGAIDAALAEAGAGIYAKSCAECHGRYQGLAPLKLVEFPNWYGEVGTDPLRALSFDQGLADTVAKTVYRDRIAAESRRGYVAPPLTGLWASAPYLHNGSVSTLAALLSPATRPERFMVGGHALDLDNVGIRIEADGSYSKAYVPFSQPAWIETSSPGRDRIGHTFGDTLTPEEKQALLEYLKLL